MSTRGRLEVILGPMFSGKTSELIRRITAAQHRGEVVLVLKPAVDSRSGFDSLVTHDGRRFPAQPIKPHHEELADLRKELGSERLRRSGMVAIDEVNFLSMAFVDICKRLVLEGKSVVAAGLDYSFIREPFGPTLKLAEVADIVVKLVARCALCGRPASAYQRIINGRPAPESSPLIMVGGKELYQPRCLACYYRERSEKG